MSVTDTSYEHIVLDERIQHVIEGTRTKIIEIVN